MSALSTASSAYAKPLVDPGYISFLPDDVLATFISPQIFTVVPTTVPDGQWNLFTKDTLQRSVDALYPRGATPNTKRYDSSTQNYSTKNYGLAGTLSPEEMAQLGPEEAQTFVTQAYLVDALRSADIDWVADYFTTSKWATDNSAPGTTWDDPNSDPIKDVMTQKRDIAGSLDGGGYQFVGVCNDKVADYLRIHPDMHGQNGSLGLATGPVDNDRVAMMLGLDRLVVGSGKHVTTLTDAGSDTVASIFGDHFLVLAVSDFQARIKGPTAGVTHLLEPARAWTYAMPDPYDPGTLGVRSILKLAHTLVSTTCGSFRSSVVA